MSVICTKIIIIVKKKFIQRFALVYTLINRSRKWPIWRITRVRPVYISHREAPVRQFKATGQLNKIFTSVIYKCSHCFRDHLLRPRRGGVFGGRGNSFLRGLIFGGQFWKCTECEGGHRTGFLCKSCQTMLWFKQLHVPFKRREKMHVGGSLSAAKCYPYDMKLGPGTYQLFLLQGM